MTIELNTFEIYERVKSGIRIALTVFILLVLNMAAYTQDDPMVVGFQIRPIFKNKFFNNGNTDLITNNVNYTIAPTLGYSWGMVVRKPLKEKLSFEGGINYIKRNYIFGVDDLDSSFSTSAEFAVIEYEIPLSAMVHVRLGDRIYMNNSAGVSLNIFKRSEKEFNEDIPYYFKRKSWINLALIANIGWEYRTESSGYFYLGTSYQLPFTKLIRMSAEYRDSDGPEYFSTDLDLGFFTVDIKYYLPSYTD